MKSKMLPASILLLYLVAVTSVQFGVHHINDDPGDATLLKFKTAAVMIDAGGSRTNEAIQNLTHQK